MISLFVALTLLLLSFLSALDHLGWLRDLAAHAGAQRWVPELVLASIAVAVFLRASSLKRRLLYPRRGMRLLTVGIAVYALGLATAMGLLVKAAGLLATELGSEWSGVPNLVAHLYPQPVFMAAQLLLVFGAFRALSNLVSPSEFAEDF
ncbi:MAG: hypothetical protein JWQ76_271 [Ramlibacter sp.]|nr:hypothetical protein [Ramlibacter sp.]